MKKISLLLLMFVSTSVLFAQQTSFGLKGGLNVANTSNNQTGGTSSRVGFHIGALAHIHLSPEIGIQPELVYSSEGGKYFNDVDGYEHSLVLNYINIPVLFQLMFGEGFRVETGPQLGFLVNAQDKVGSNNTYNVSTRDFKSVNFAWAFGLGYLTASGLGIDARYNLGISNINNVNYNTIHNNVFQAGIFYQFSPSRTYARRTYTRRRR